MTSTSPGGRVPRMVVALVVVFVLHAAYGSYLALGGARPNPTLTALLIACLFTNAESGAWLGFFVGLLEASFSARFVGSYIVTRTLAGFLVGLLEERIFRDNIFVAIAVVYVGTVASDLCLYVFAPQHPAIRWVIGTLLMAAYNAAFAIPLYLLFKRISPK